MQGWPRIRRLSVGSAWTGEPLPAATPVAEVLVSQVEGGYFVEVDAPFHGDPAPLSAPGPTDRLWDFEAVELFLAGASDEPFLYSELEMGPHGHHMVLRFLRPRTALDRALPLAYRASIEGERWRGLAFVPAILVPRPPLRAAAFSLFGPAAARRHLASVALPGAVPDFHQPEVFPLLFPEDAS